MVEKEEIRARISGKLAVLDEILSVLKDSVPSNLEEYEDSELRVKWEAERGLQLVSEVELDIIAMLNKLLTKGLVGEEKSMITSVSKELGEGIAKAVMERRKLRNELVHAYTIKRDREFFEQAINLEDVLKFKKAVMALLRER
jgi:uncharacterized protein YutE (UPF0331/DUF86 family)